MRFGCLAAVNCAVDSGVSTPTLKALAVARDIQPRDDVSGPTLWALCVEPLPNTPLSLRRCSYLPGTVGSLVEAAETHASSLFAVPWTAVSINSSDAPDWQTNAIDPPAVLLSLKPVFRLQCHLEQVHAFASAGSVRASEGSLACTHTWDRQRVLRCHVGRSQALGELVVTFPWHNTCLGASAP